MHDESNIKSVSISYGEDSVDILLFEGTEPSALEKSLTGRFGLGHHDFHLTQSGSNAIVPLTSALPAGMKLTLHVYRRRGHHPHMFEALNAAFHPHQQAPADLPVVIEDQAQEQQQTRPEESSTSPPRDAGSGMQTPLLEEQKGQTKNSPEGRQASVRQASTRQASSLMRSGTASFWSKKRESWAEHREKTIRLDEEGQDRQGSMRAFSKFGELDLDELDDRQATLVVCEEIAEQTKTVERFSRLSSELANERTLLAWVRTGLATVRTVFTFLALAGTSVAWTNDVLLAQMLMMTAVLFAGLSGTVRYVKVRDALRMAEPPQYFGRMSVKWFVGIVLVTYIAIAAGVYTQHWHKA
mmetsp:Transcript_145423/g.253775  ORF Transcript_145423/g.253775 Transcript_145423/m.253775 type:complete len:355 (+) Transcript_145423:71-1135(+)